MASERVQKILAQAGIASRRKAEELIAEGEVTINGKIAKLGDKAELGKDSIKVRGKLLRSVEAPIYLAFNKPKAVLSTLSDPEGRPTLTDYLDKIHSRVYPVGRLDFNSDGLILMTNDGAFAEKLQRREDIPRVYQVKVKGHPSDEMIARLEKGARLESRFIKPHSVRYAEEYDKKSRIEVVIMGAGAIDIKTLFENKGFLIEKMTRTAIGHITLRGILPGHYRLLKASQVQALLDQPELAMRDIEKAAAEKVWRKSDQVREDEAHGRGPKIKPLGSRDSDKDRKPGISPVKPLKVKARGSKSIPRVSNTRMPRISPVMSSERPARSPVKPVFGNTKGNTKRRPTSR